jgi:hypothetical protein
METRLKTYRSEAKFQSDRGLMEAQGWKVRSSQYRVQGAPYVNVDEVDLRVTHALNTGQPAIHVAPEPGVLIYLVARFTSFVVLVGAALIGWLWSKRRSERRVDVLYERVERG